MRMTIVLCLLAAVVLPAAASSYDRKPVTMAGLYPDGWGQSLSTYQAIGRARFSGRRVYCTGVFMLGYRNQSSWIHGTTRYWDKALCAAVWDPSVWHGKSFVLDAKKSRTPMYRVHIF